MRIGVHSRSLASFAPILSPFRIVSKSVQITSPCPNFDIRHSRRDRCQSSQHPRHYWPSAHIDFALCPHPPRPLTLSEGTS
ncbi:hypothetical protein PFISCL1PPCAC_23350, partial [Pristionchus fissidentatus]